MWPLKAKAFEAKHSYLLTGNNLYFLRFSVPRILNPVYLVAEMGFWPLWPICQGHRKIKLLQPCALTQRLPLPNFVQIGPYLLKIFGFMSNGTDPLAGSKISDLASHSQLASLVVRATRRSINLHL